MKLYIDQQEVCDNILSEVTLSFDADDMRDIEQASKENNITIEVEASAQNLILFGGEGFLHAKQRFNAEEHTATLTEEGVVVAAGKVTMTAAKRQNNSTIYTLQITRSAADWAENAASTLLSQSNMDFSMLLTLDEIKSRWEGDSPVKFVPVYRDCYVDSNSAVTEGSILYARAIDDYHPFINVNSVVESVFEESDYSVVSEFMGEELFQGLYMSGAYSSQNNDEASDAMNFLVKKLDTNSTTANSFGRVYLSPHMVINCVDNIVDIESLDEDSQCFTRNDCFSLNGNTLTFTPTTSVSVGFEIKLNYVSDCSIATRDTMQAFDTIYLYDGNMTSLTVVNQNEDLRQSATQPLFTYRVIVFDADDSDIFQIGVDVQNSSDVEMLTSWEGRTTTFTTPAESYMGTLGDVHLYQWVNGAYQEYGDDWALYYGHIEESSEVQVQITIRTPPKTITPTSPLEFVGMFIQGANSGDSFSLLPGCYIKPIFSTRPYDSTYISFEDIAQQSFDQQELLSSIQQMFNLRLYTDPFAQRVYIEPSEQIYDTETVWDWSDKIVLDQAITFEDRAIEVHKERSWGYQQGDGLINRYKTDYMVPGTTLPAAPESDPEQSIDGSSSPDFGTWSIETDSAAAMESNGTTLNSIFSPSLNDTSGVLIVGDRDDSEIVDTYDFSPRIVRWLGIIESQNEEMPYVAFHSTRGTTPYEGDGVTLCFEDRDDIRGLNQYYSDEALRDGSAQYVSLTLKLTTHEVVTLLSPTPGAASVLSTFELLIDGESAICRLHSIDNYKVGSDEAKCKFLIVG